MWKRRQMRKAQIKEYNKGIDTKRLSITAAVLTTTSSSKFKDKSQQDHLPKLNEESTNNTDAANDLDFVPAENSAPTEKRKKMKKTPIFW